HLELPGMLEDPYVEVALQAPPSPDYIPGPEEPKQAPPLPDYVPGPKHANDEIVAEDQPYAEDASPTAQSLEYVPESDLEAYPEEDDDEDPEEDPVDYPADGGDDGDDEEGSSEDDDIDIEANEEEEEEHPAPADSVVVALPAADQAPSAEETEPFKTDESAATPPPHPAYRITFGLGYEVGESSSVAAARPAGGLRADYGFVTTIDREIRRDPEREVGYRITDSWDKIVETLQGAPVSTDTELAGYMREFETRVRRQIGTSEMLRADHKRFAEIRGLRTTDRTQQQQLIQILTVMQTLQGQHVMLSEVQMAMIAIILKRVLEGQNELLVNVLTLTFSSVNHYISKALRELPVFPNESDKNEKYIGGLPDMIHGSVVASKPKTMQEAVAITTELMDQKIRTFAEREIVSKRKFEDTSRSTQNQQQQPNKRQNTGRVYTATSGENKQYGGYKPLCAKCNYHHDGPCAPKCHKCNKVGHFARDCRSTTNTNNANNQRGTGSVQKPTCYECGVQGHFKRECPKLKNNNNHGNQGGRDNAPAKVYAVGRAGTDPDSNVVT
nr:hypothetical protein [Tanacetum cinerariifolium]